MHNQKETLNFFIQAYSNVCRYQLLKFQNRIMKVATLKLPPLPRRLSFKKLRINCAQAQFVYRGQLVKNIESAQTSVEDIPQIIKENETTVTLKRPLSKKSDQQAKSIRIRDGLNSTKASKNTTSLDSHQNFSNIPPKITAKSWILYQMRRGQVLYSKRSKKTRQMASLTKMMNLITILELIERFGLSEKKIMIKATKYSSQIEGTTAQIKSGWIYRIQDLFYGMMLPSGNDAAFLLAQFGGFIIERGGLKNEEELKSNVLDYRNGGFAYTFIKQMNLLAQRLGMANSNFSNPHGLNHTENLSCAQDLALLCSYAMKNSTFRKVVQTRRYQYKRTFQTQNKTQQSQKEIQNQQIVGIWQNTNKMLGEGWSGIKTGITPNAGPCLAASFYKILGGRQYQFLAILLNSESMQARWKQVACLVDWAIMTRLYV